MLENPTVGLNKGVRKKHLHHSEYAINVTHTIIKYGLLSHDCFVISS